MNRTGSTGVVILIIVLSTVVSCATTAVEPTPTVSPSGPSPVLTPSLPAISETTPVANTSSGMVEELSIEDLTVRAECILVGTVKDMQSYWNTQRTVIYTDVAVSVERVFKGCSDQQEIVVRVPGGTVGEISMQASAAPSFQNGERAILFLQREGDTLSVLGGFQGKLTIEEDTVVKPGVSLSDFVRGIEQTLP